MGCALYTAKYGNCLRGPSSAQWKEGNRLWTDPGEGVALSLGAPFSVFSHSLKGNRSGGKGQPVPLQARSAGRPWQLSGAWGTHYCLSPPLEILPQFQDKRKGPTSIPRGGAAALWAEKRGGGPGRTEGSMRPRGSWSEQGVGWPVPEGVKHNPLFVYRTHNGSLWVSLLSFCVSCTGTGPSPRGPTGSGRTVPSRVRTVLLRT